MKYELALKLAKTETPEQMAYRIVELYETIETLETERDDLRTNAERWERAWQRAVEERNKIGEALDTVAQIASAYVSLTGNIRAEERLEKALAAIKEE